MIEHIVYFQSVHSGSDLIIELAGCDTGENALQVILGDLNAKTMVDIMGGSCPKIKDCGGGRWSVSWHSPPLDSEDRVRYTYSG